MTKATIGVDLGGTKILAVRWENDAVTATERADKPAEGLRSSAVFEVVRRLWTSDVGAVGAGLAGLVTDGVFMWGPHVPGTGISIRDRLTLEFGVPAFVDNDANTAALAELRLGAGRGYRDFLLVTVGTGIGGAIVTDGRVRRGASGFAGEWGHIDLTGASSSRECACGRRGCWETVVSGPAIARLGGGDNAIEQVGSDLGRGLAALATIFDPEAIIVGGGVADLGERLLEPARGVLADQLHGGSRRVPPALVAAELGPRAGAIGAALLAAATAP